MMPSPTRRARRRAAACSIAAAIVGSGLVRSAHAADRYWVAGSGFWDIPSAWSATPGGPGAAGVPNVGDNAYVFSNVSLTLTRDATVASSAQPGLNLLQLTGTGAFPVAVIQT